MSDVRYQTKGGSKRENKHFQIYLALGPLLTENLRLEVEVMISFLSLFHFNFLIF